MSSYFHEMRLDISCALSARQKIHMKCQSLFSLKNNSKNVRKSSAVILLSILMFKINPSVLCQMLVLLFVYYPNLLKGTVNS